MAYNFKPDDIVTWTYNKKDCYSRLVRTGDNGLQKYKQFRELNFPIAAYAVVIKVRVLVSSIVKELFL